MSKSKVLIVSHGHPDLSKGGAEVASYNLFKEYLNQGVDAYYLARTDRLPHPGASFSVWNNTREILFHTHMENFFVFTSRNLEQIFKDFAQLLQMLKPDVVHFHHYVHIGIEIIRVVKNVLPNTKIVFTFHEYLAICTHNGQMIKKLETGHQLCYKSSPGECSQCFPQTAPSEFFLRSMHLKAFFNLVDQYISPSNFLIDRYVQWGLPKEKFVMLENAHPDVEKLPVRKIEKGSKRNHFAYFGQLNQYKGVDVLLESILQIPEKQRGDIHLAIHGANLESQAPDFQKKINSLIENLEGNVKFYGKYDLHEMGDLLVDVDWVIIPSIWWENSPMVIQEAFRFGRPIIGTDIGGVREKIENIGGILFKNNNALDLSHKLLEALSEKKWEETYAQIVPTVSIAECAKKHLEIYFPENKKRKL